MMDLIQNGARPCDCYAKFRQFEENLNAEGTYLHIGARVRCDCGAEWDLCDDQRDGRHWRKAFSS
jgi:hypothetical protein